MFTNVCIDDNTNPDFIRTWNTHYCMLFARIATTEQPRSRSECSAVIGRCCSILWIIYEGVAPVFALEISTRQSLLFVQLRGSSASYLLPPECLQVDCRGVTHASFDIHCGTTQSWFVLKRAQQTWKSSAIMHASYQLTTEKEESIEMARVQSFI